MGYCEHDKEPSGSINLEVYGVAEELFYFSGKTRLRGRLSALWSNFHFRQIAFRDRLEVVAIVSVKGIGL
jgi:hypothetical protein